ncbi:bromodomain adjacent to zinc finger domain protein 1A-like [Macrobrachium nipponense]|uniref:bromodomain adjacent to zinc finger domain protein 1A-like n=1 Tax=Macrobrachium nipponense TaxID=159736 RepID=UPI0030C85F24
MPLLNKKPFIRREPPPNLQDTDTVFYSDITNEVFTDYEDYWARLVLCHAMVWTCELTGRPNLTYAEAVESENRARKCLANVPEELRKPMLYIATLTRRGRYVDMSDDVELQLGKIDDDIEIVKVVSKKEEKTKGGQKEDEDEDYPPFATFKYEVIEVETLGSLPASG